MLNASQTWYNNSSNPLTVSGAVSGASALLTKTGSGLVNVTGAATYGGGTTVSAGTLAFSNSGALGNTNQVSINNAGNVLQASTPLTIPSTIPFNFGNRWTVSGANSITIAGTSTQWSNSQQLTNSITSGGTFTLAVPVYLSNNTTARNLTIAGAGTTLVSGAIADGNGSKPVAA